MPKYEELEKSICYVIKEQHIKLGYSANSRWLYYPLSALNHMLGMDCDVTGMEDVVAVFRKYSDKVCVKEAGSDEFDMLVWFEDGKPDPFVYCLADEMGHVTYHRMTMAELKERM